MLDIVLAGVLAAVTVMIPIIIWKLGYWTGQQDEARRHLWERIERVPATRCQIHDERGKPVGPAYRQNPETFEWEVIEGEEVPGC
jgi:hypothetical protein